MKAIKIISCLILGMNLATCCTQKQEARKPISHTSGQFMKESVERNKKLNKKEEDAIDRIIKKDTAASYISSSKGYWYYYVIKSTGETLKPKKGDIAFFDYDVKDLNGATIYSQEELKTQKYVVDKQNIMSGLREGLKIMHKGDKITFVFPSHLGYGYHGDNNRIGTNKPLICTVTLKSFEPDTSNKN
jgi:gliding motility-associated peptidyl-prolyl isomerase